MWPTGCPSWPVQNRCSSPSVGRIDMYWTLSTPFDNIRPELTAASGSCRATVGVKIGGTRNASRDQRQLRARMTDARVEHLSFPTTKQRTVSGIRRHQGVSDHTVWRVLSFRQRGRLVPPPFTISIRLDSRAAGTPDQGPGIRTAAQPHAVKPLSGTPESKCTAVRMPEYCSAAHWP